VEVKGMGKHEENRASDQITLSGRMGAGCLIDAVWTAYKSMV
jgi:hypothetical protein